MQLKQLQKKKQEATKNQIGLDKRESGIGLIEIIIALGVAVIIVTALVTLSVFTLHSSTESQMLMKGTRLANQEMEELRVAREQYVEDATGTGTTWEDFYNLLVDCPTECPPPEGETGCYVNSSFEIAEGTQTLERDFTICVGAASVDEDTLDIITTAAWDPTGSATPKTASSTSRFTNWK